MRQLWYTLDVGFHIKLCLILVVNLGLYIKLNLNLGIVNLGLEKVILIYHILGLFDCACILVINSKILDYGLWHVRYFCWVKFTNLDPFLINKIYRTNLKFEFVLEYLLWILYISRYLHLNYFCFCINPFCNSVGWLWIYDTWRMKFHEKKMRLEKL